MNKRPPSRPKYALLSFLLLLLLFVPLSVARAQQESSGTPLARIQQSESLAIGGVPIRLGMPQDDAISRLSERYTLKETNSPGVWDVRDGGRVIGAVRFLAGRVVFISREIGEVDSETGLADGLYRAVKGYEQQGHSPCEVKTATYPSGPSETVETLSVTCRGQQTHLEVGLVGDQRNQYVFVSEVLEYPVAALNELKRAGAASGSELSVQPTDSERNRRSSELADSSALVTATPGDHVPGDELAQIAAHNRALCDQTITVAGLTPRGLVLYVPAEGQKFMAKNSQNYPHMCLVEDATKVVPGVPRYLLVYAYSENAFAGFQPVTQVNTASAYVSGSGTVANSYGEMWNFTYSGTVEATEIDTIEEPYVIQSHSLYLNAYDENGALVSSHSITLSRQIGGNGASAIGYNGAQLISMLWNNPSRLIKSVLKDVQKDSAKYKK